MKVRTLLVTAALAFVCAYALTLSFHPKQAQRHVRTDWFCDLPDANGNPVTVCVATGESTEPTGPAQ